MFLENAQGACTDNSETGFISHQEALSIVEAESVIAKYSRLVHAKNSENVVRIVGGIIWLDAEGRQRQWALTLSPLTIFTTGIVEAPHEEQSRLRDWSRLTPPALTILNTVHAKGSESKTL